MTPRAPQAIVLALIVALLILYFIPHPKHP